MKLNDLTPARGSKKRRRRVGRGLGSGRGKTAGRGQKGQKSRSGFSQGTGWEGGRSRLVMRLPKRGFTRKGEEIQIVNVGDLNVFESGTTVDAALLAERGLVRSGNKPVKLLGDGDLEVEGLTIDLDAWSVGAVRAVQAKGGQVLRYEEGAQGDGAEASDDEERPEPGDEA